MISLVNNLARAFAANFRNIRQTNAKYSLSQHFDVE